MFAPIALSKSCGEAGNEDEEEILPMVGIKERDKKENEGQRQ